MTTLSELFPSMPMKENVDLKLVQQANASWPHDLSSHIGYISICCLGEQCSLIPTP